MTTTLPRPSRRACSTSASAACASSATSADARGPSAAACAFSPPASRLDEREREPLAALGERTCRRRETLTLGERAIERLEPAAGDPHALRQRCELGRRLARRGGGRIGLALEPGRIDSCGLLGGGELGAGVREQGLRALGSQGQALGGRPQPVLALAGGRGGRHGCTGRLELLGRRAGHHVLERGLEACGQRLGRLAPHAQALGGAAEPVERCRGGLAPPGCVCELLLRAAALQQDVLEPRLRALALEPRRRPALLDAGRPLLLHGEVELRDSSLEAGDLAAQLLGPLRRSRLERERPQAFPDLVLEVAGALDLGGHPRQLQLRSVATPLETAQPRRLLEQRPPLGGLARQDLLDAPLADDRGPGGQPDLRQQLDEVDATHPRAVQQVLALAAAVQPAREGDLRERQLGEGSVLVVEEQLDLAEVGAPSTGGAGEEDVVGLLGPQLAGRERPGRPEQRVSDVRLPGAVGPDDHGDAGLQANLDRVRERLEAAQAQRAQVHARPSLTRAADDPD